MFVLSSVFKSFSQPQTSAATIWNLPEEICLYIIKYLHIKDLLTMKVVNPYFNDLITRNNCLLSSVKFHNCWPSLENSRHFQRAANCGNVEALVKSGIAYLYNEGLPEEFDEHNLNMNGSKAAEQFSKIERMNSTAEPFTWLFFRPPWSVSGACCKERIFNTMKSSVEAHPDKQIALCVAKTLKLIDGEEKDLAQQYLQQAMELGSGSAAFLLWQQKYSNKCFDAANELNCIRELREVTNMGCLDASLSLCDLYARSKLGGLHPSRAATFVKKIFKVARPTGTHSLYKKSRNLSPSVRYILIDWLIDVVGMKGLSNQTLHTIVSVIDRFLATQIIPREKLQLLGVSAMVICSRLLGNDVVTIREAVWLTDNTYTYADVVRMMGEITAALKGNMRIATSHDYIKIANVLAKMEDKTSCLAEYICELCMLQSEMGQYSPAEVACSAVLLARLLLKSETPWSNKMEEFTGFSSEDISRCAFHIHEKCFLEGSVIDNRDVTLQAAKLKYSDEKYHHVSSIKIISYEKLCDILGVKDFYLNGTDVNLRFRNSDTLIISPCRGTSKRTAPKYTTPAVDDDSCCNDYIISDYWEDHDLFGALVRPVKSQHCCVRDNNLPSERYSIHTNGASTVSICVHSISTSSSGVSCSHVASNSCSKNAMFIFDEKMSDVYVSGQDCINKASCQQLRRIGSATKMTSPSALKRKKRS